MERFGLTERQAVAILDMQLRRLTGLERDKIDAEYQELQKQIARFREILSDVNQVLQIIKDELTEISDRFGDERRTEITGADGEIEIEDLIADEDIVVTLTHHGYIKRLPVSSYRSQRRGGRGISALSTKDDDFVEHLFITSTHSYIVFFTNRGRGFRLRGYEIPEASRQARGTALVNLLQLEPGETVQATLPVSSFSDDNSYVVMATKQGRIKRTAVSEFDSPRAGLIAIKLVEGDELIGARHTSGSEEIILVTAGGMSIRFQETDVRSMGRAAQGVKGIELEPGDYVVGMDVVTDDAQLLVVTKNGYGKRTPLEEYRIQNRGGKGIKTMQMSERNGSIVGVKVVRDDTELMIISVEGIMIRIRVDEISILGRNTQGVRLMRLDENDKVVALAHLAARDDD